MKLNMLGFLGFLGMLGTLGSKLDAPELYSLYVLFALFGLFGYKEKQNNEIPKQFFTRRNYYDFKLKYILWLILESYNQKNDKEKTNCQDVYSFDFLCCISNYHCISCSSTSHYQSSSGCNKYECYYNFHNIYFRICFPQSLLWLALSGWRLPVGCESTKQ